MDMDLDLSGFFLFLLNVKKRPKPQFCQHRLALIVSQPKL